MSELEVGEVIGMWPNPHLIRRHVRERKIKLALIHRETFIPQSYVWGGEAQVDWYEAYADICGEREKAYVFCMRSMASGGAFHCAFPHASQQAFLEAHELAFADFSGVFKTLRYDNLKSAVKMILRGHPATDKPCSLGGCGVSNPFRQLVTRQTASPANNLNSKEIYYNFAYVK